ncbi:hypothetical protein TNCT_382841 [Trichonephila clavata]|uniref:Uncharacterized protein n=1 Tax=Trichonephila clavata TaxID=2740835 RepID=A0A8X6IM75_TRICU|nr:hypothetical protein TNCT_382841 [Trichonephila clavata]
MTLFSLPQMSDDDRLSLTTAVSDEEEAPADPRSTAHPSSSRSRSGAAAAASFNCTGAVRKAGRRARWSLKTGSTASTRRAAATAPGVDASYNRTRENLPPKRSSR